MHLSFRIVTRTRTLNHCYHTPVCPSTSQFYVEGSLFRTRRRDTSCTLPCIREESVYVSRAWSSPTSWGSKSSYSPLASHDAVHLYTCITVLASHTRMHTCVQSFVDRLPTSTTCHCTLIFLDLMLRSPPPQNCSVTSHFALYTVSRHSCTSQFEIHILGYQTNSTSAGVCLTSASGGD